MRVLYLDVLLLLNFCMDYMALYLTGAFLHRKRSAWRLCGAAAFGAVYALASVLFAGNETVGNILSVAVACLLAYIAYGGEGGAGKFLRLLALFYGISFLLGGTVTAAYVLLDSYLPHAVLSDSENGDLRLVIFSLTAGISGIAIRLIGAWLERKESARSCRVTVFLDGKGVSFDALLDSGNLLSDPLSGRRVIIASSSSLVGLMETNVLKMLANGEQSIAFLPKQIRRRVRLIPVHGIGGDRLLVGILPDRILLAPSEEQQSARSTHSIDAILAVDGDAKDGYGGYGGVVPTGLAS